MRNLSRHEGRSLNLFLLAPQFLFLILLQLARNVAELALLQLRLPEDGVGVVETMLDPSFLPNVVQVDETTGVGVSVCCGKDTTTTQLQCIVNAEIVVVLRIQHTVGKSLTTAYTEQVASQARAVTVNIVQRWALLGSDTGAHGTHAQSHVLVAVDKVRKNLASGGDTDAALVAEFVKAALHAQPREPVLAIGSTTSHRAQEHRVNLDDLLDGLRSDPVTGCGTRIGRDDDSALETEGEGGSSVSDLDRAVGVGTVVSRGAEP